MSIQEEREAAKARLEEIAELRRQLLDATRLIRALRQVLAAYRLGWQSPESALDTLAEMRDRFK